MSKVPMELLRAADQMAFGAVRISFCTLMIGSAHSGVEEPTSQRSLFLA
jgi:hypothetical protein